MNRCLPFVFALSLTACAAQPTTTFPSDPALDQIAFSAKQIQARWNILGSIAEHEHPGAFAVLDDYGSKYPDSLRRPVTVKWAGPIGPLVQMLAREANVSPSIVGDPPPNPILVYVDAHNTRIGDVLRDVGYQAGARANIRVIPYDGGQRVELVYATP